MGPLIAVIEKRLNCSPSIFFKHILKILNQVINESFLSSNIHTANMSHACLVDIVDVAEKSKQREIEGGHYPHKIKLAAGI